MARLPIAFAVALLSVEAYGATPTYYANQAQFENALGASVSDDYTNPAYVFNQDNVTMSGVLDETDYASTGHDNLNIVGSPEPYYCAGCNGSFELGFTTTSVGNPEGVAAAGFRVRTHNLGLPYFAFITFADGTTDNVALPGEGEFWGVVADERVERIHVGLSDGGTTVNGSFSINELIIGGTCASDADCPSTGNECSPMMCEFGVCTQTERTGPCDDGSLCTENDTCTDGACVGTPVVCDDGNECTLDLCADELGCVVQLTTDPCDDGIECTVRDTCDEGACVGEPIDCGGDDGDTGDDAGAEDDGSADDASGDDGLGDDDDSSADGLDDDGTPPPMGDSGDTGGVGFDDAGEGSDGGAMADGDAAGCSCRTSGSAGTAWWLLALLGVVRRRKPRHTELRGDQP